VFSARLLKDLVQAFGAEPRRARAALTALRELYEDWRCHPAVPPATLKGGGSGWHWRRGPNAMAA